MTDSHLHKHEGLQSATADGLDAIRPVNQNSVCAFSPYARRSLQSAYATQPAAMQQSRYSSTLLGYLEQKGICATQEGRERR
jgi:hypothetical protein